MARTENTKTRAAHVYATVRSEILNGVLEPGQPLRPGELRHRYGVSISVIREALSRLAEQHIVRVEANHGFMVAPLTSKDLKDLSATRVVVEGYALRTAIERGDLSWETRVVATAHRLFSTPSRVDGEVAHVNEEWSQAHHAFHRALIEACDMPPLIGICDSLFDASEMYRRLSAPFTAQNRDVVAEHRSIMDATLARDASLAVKRLTVHYETTTNLLLEKLVMEPEPTSATPTSAKTSP